MPNRRSHRFSTAFRSVAALAVASPFAIVTATHLTQAAAPAPVHQEFQQAAIMEDLPNEVMGAVQSMTSQFGIQIPGLSGMNIPGLGGGGNPALTSPGLTGPGGLTNPSAEVNPALTGTNPGLTGPATGAPNLNDPALANPGLTNPAAPADATAPASTAGVGAGPTGVNPALTDPAVGGVGATDPALGGAGLTNPALSDPALAGLGAPGLGSTGGGGSIVSDAMSAVNQLGVGQVVDLIKGAIPAAGAATQGAAAPPPAG